MFDKKLFDKISYICDDSNYSLLERGTYYIFETKRNGISYGVVETNDRQKGIVFGFNEDGCNYNFLYRSLTNLLISRIYSKGNSDYNLLIKIRKYVSRKERIKRIMGNVYN